MPLRTQTPFSLIFHQMIIRTGKVFGDENPLSTLSLEVFLTYRFLPEFTLPCPKLTRHLRYSTIQIANRSTDRSLHKRSHRHESMGVGRGCGGQATANVTHSFTRVWECQEWGLIQRHITHMWIRKQALALCKMAKILRRDLRIRTGLGMVLYLSGFFLFVFKLITPIT